MNSAEWHLEQAEALLSGAVEAPTLDIDTAFTRRAIAHIQLAQAINAQGMMAATVALQRRTSEVLDESARKLNET